MAAAFPRMEVAVLGELLAVAAQEVAGDLPLTVRRQKVAGRIPPLPWMTISPSR